MDIMRRETSSTREVQAVLLNLGIAVVMSVLGITIFVLFWLKNDWYKLPDFQNGRYQKEFDKPINKFVPYLRAIFSTVKTRNADLFINRFGFEYYFYLQFHRSFTKTCILSFGLICATTAVYTVIAGQNWDFLFSRIIGIYYSGTKTHPILNTMIMGGISLLVSHRMRKMMLRFQGHLARKAAQIKENTHDEYHFILNTALLYGCSPHDEDQSILIPYMRRLISDNKIKAVIQQQSSPADHVQLARILTEIDETLIYWNHLWYVKYVGRFLYYRIMQCCQEV